VSHKNQINFFEIVVKAFPKHFSQKVIDIGSLDINGGPHKLFNAFEYVGVDIGKGPNVNIVARGEEVNFSENYFDVSMSSECFEHNPNFIATIHNMVRMTKKDGLIVFSAAGTGRKEHGTPRSDQGYSAPLLSGINKFYYRNVSKRSIKSITDSELLSYTLCFRNWLSRDIYFIGIKNPTPEMRKQIVKINKEIRSYVRNQNITFICNFAKHPVRNVIDLMPFGVVFNLVIIKHKMQFYGIKSHKNLCKVCRFV